jgi:ketosteroid isomerase-like protein
VEVEHRPAAVWTVDDGQVTAVTFFLDRDEAFEFAGIGG